MVATKSVKIVFKDGSHVFLDASPSQSHDRNSKSTEHKIEDGSTISDHIIEGPEGVSISGFLTSIAPKDSNSEFPHIETFEKLDSARKRKELFTVHTTLKTYVKMCLEKLTAKVEAKSSESLFIDLSFKAFITTTAKTADIPKTAVGKKKPGENKEQAKKTIKKDQDRFTKKSSSGLKPPKVPSAGQVTKMANNAKAAVNPSKALSNTKSWAAKGLDSAKSLFKF